MGIFSRLGTLIKSNINDLITKAEDPEKMLSQVLLEMQQQLVDAKKAVAVAIADEKKLQKQTVVEQDKAKEWERKAMVAVRGGDDGLARQALARKQEHENIAGQFQSQWVAQKQAVEKLKDALRLLNNKIEEAKRKKNILIARKKRAEAQQQIANTMQGLGDTSAFDTFDRMAERISLMEAEAEAGAELAGELSGDNLESKFLALEAGSSDDDALAELKAKMGLLEAPKASEKMLKAGDDKDLETPGAKETMAGSHLSAEDLKELEDLDLSDLDGKSSSK
ncbi:MAG: PspA/IM30 family protein [Kofleriaceae bacterium]|jgi:phage shock protein A|nr:PspA/IM30 family protein [Kofleriaceae bacterium]MBP9167648.1 PspA/IM30 family protein [Kofleriaceae bacterium]MBP9856730.1 PspA/IM30 family protein [Kofleriaceae bacterium]